jgi:micrococcal nuclease
MRRRLCLALALVIVVVGQADAQTCRVVSVHDGDTITALADGNRQVKVRLTGIDAPELGQPFGRAAKRHLSGMVFGKTIEIEAGKKDRWGRTLGAVKVDGKPVAEAMVAEGLAWHYTRYSDDQRLAAAEREARVARRGLWQDPQPVPPWEWRATEKRR